ncbi:L-2-amino-thiazoline-4-carboxylic acid hydrolase [Candidatus Zixiibacteriota bacterium]
MMMSSKSGNYQSRREFVFKVVPACALGCLGCGDVFAAALADSADSVTADIPPFDQELTLTYRRLFNFRYKSNFIPVFQAIAKDIGREKTLAMIRKASSLNNRELGARLATKKQTNDFHTFAEPFRNPQGMLRQVNIYEIIEDAERVFALNFTGCLVADIFRESAAADIGYAALCHADFALPAGFNPQIKLIRDKTLMEGHDCCNHRYVWEG